MANNFARKDGVALATDTLIYTVPALTTAILFDAQITNVDGTNKVSHFVTLRIQKVDTSYTQIFQDLEVPYGRATPVPKQIMVAGEKLYIKSDTASMLSCGFQIVERT